MIEDVDLGPSQAADLRREAEQRLHNQNATPIEGMAEVDVRACSTSCRSTRSNWKCRMRSCCEPKRPSQEASDKYHDLFDFAPVGYFRLDERAESWRSIWPGRPLLGLDRSTAVKQRFAQFVAMEHRAAFAEFLIAVLQADGKQTCEIDLQRGEQRGAAMLEGIRTHAARRETILPRHRDRHHPRKQIDNVQTFLLKCGSRSPVKISSKSRGAITSPRVWEWITFASIGSWATG